MVGGARLGPGGSGHGQGVPGRPQPHSRGDHLRRQLRLRPRHGSAEGAALADPVGLESAGEGGARGRVSGCPPTLPAPLPPQLPAHTSSSSFLRLSSARSRSGSCSASPRCTRRRLSCTPSCTAATCGAPAGTRRRHRAGTRADRTPGARGRALRAGTAPTGIPHPAHGDTPGSRGPASPRFPGSPRDTHGAEDAGAARALLQAQPLVGHGLAEAHGAAGQLLRGEAVAVRDPLPAAGARRRCPPPRCSP